MSPSRLWNLWAYVVQRISSTSLQNHLKHNPYTEMKQNSFGIWANVTFHEHVKEVTLARLSKSWNQEFLCQIGILLHSRDQHLLPRIPPHCLPPADLRLVWRLRRRSLHQSFLRNDRISFRRISFKWNQLKRRIGTLPWMNAFMRKNLNSICGFGNIL